MKPQRPYLLRALYDWIVDSGEVPYVLVNAEVAGVVVPEEHIKDGQIVLNLSPDAVRDLMIDDSAVSCSGRFSGQAFNLYLPMASVSAIYCKDSTTGFAFPDEEFEVPERNTDPDPDDDKPTLRLV